MKIVSRNPIDGVCLVGGDIGCEYPEAGHEVADQREKQRKVTELLETSADVEHQFYFAKHLLLVFHGFEKAEQPRDLDKFPQLANSCNSDKLVDIRRHQQIQREDSHDVDQEPGSNVLLCDGFAAVDYIIIFVLQRHVEVADYVQHEKGVNRVGEPLSVGEHIRKGHIERSLETGNEEHHADDDVPPDLACVGWVDHHPLPLLLVLGILQINQH